MPEIKVKVVATNAHCVPIRATPGSAGFDLFALEFKTLHVGEIYKVRTGVAMSVPIGFEGQIRPHIALALKGVILMDSPGTIDSDYRGEIVLPMRSELVSIQLHAGDRIAQIVFHELPKVSLEVSESLEMDSVRGLGGFGSTG